MKKAQNMPYQSRTLGAEAWYRFKKNKLALGALAIFILLALMAITTIIIDLVTHNSFYDKYVISQDLLQRLQPPSKEHILGMDEFGRDILLRIIWGTRYSLFMGAFAVLGASVLGGIIGAVAGYYNMMDTLLMRIMDVFLAIPTTLLAVAIVAAMGPSLVNVVLAIAISQTPTFARVIRAQVLTIKDQEFVEAARSAGERCTHHFPLHRSQRPVPHDRSGHDGHGKRDSFHRWPFLHRHGHSGSDARMGRNAFQRPYLHP